MRTYFQAVAVFVVLCLPTLTAAGEGNAPQVTDDEAPPAEEAPVVEPARVPVLLLARAGYGLMIVNSARTLQHGGRVGAGFALWRHLELAASLDLLVPLTAEGHERVRLVRWPLRVLASGYFSIWRLDFGLGVGLVIDFFDVKGLTGEQPDDPRRVNPGLTAAALVQLRLTEMFAFWISPGMDVYKVGYWFVSTTRELAFDYGQVQGHLMAGVAFLFEIR